MCDLRFTAASASFLAFTSSFPLSAAAADPFELVRAAIRLPCQASPGTGLASLSDRLPGARSKWNWVRYSADGIDAQPLVFRMVFEVADHDQLTVEFTGPIGDPDYVTIQYLQGALQRPYLLARANGSCAIHTARIMAYDDQGRPEWLQDADERLHPVGAPEPLNPPVPAGRDPPGIPVGVVDSGVNYLLPEIASRLARDRDGQILGYDYRDLDRRPFDVEPASDPFFPDHHGTGVASLLLEQAPVAKLVPYRYPGQAMRRMAALVENAAIHDVRLINLSLAAPDREQWLAFEGAAEAHPDMLFVVAAGNMDHDLQLNPAYPAGFHPDNMIVVTSAGADGRLSAGVNYGPQAVDLMAPGEDVMALDFDGVHRPVSGSSYATARVSGLAACLLADHPKWSIAELKSAIFHEARRDDDALVAQGFLPEQVFGNRGACRKVLACGASDRGC
jgi:subtilisin family serine protease